MSHHYCEPDTPPLPPQPEGVADDGTKKYTPAELLDMAQSLNEALDSMEVLDSSKLRDVLERYDVVTRIAATVNRVKKRTDAAKNEAKALVILTLEEEELDGAPVTIDGQKLHFAKYEFRAANIIDREAFAEWAASEDGESYFESEPRVRQELLNALVTQCDDDGAPLPPGLDIYRETRLSRTAK